MQKKRGILFLLECGNVNEKTYCEILNKVSDGRKNKAQSYQFFTDRVLSVMAELSLMYLLRKYYGYDASEYTILQQECGKPYLVNIPSIEFNISHTNSLVAVLVANVEVGIDVEKWCRISARTAYAGRFCRRAGNPPQ